MDHSAEVFAAAMLTYKVTTDTGEILIDGHVTSVVDGCLLIYKGIFIDEECTQIMPVPAGFFAPGAWRSCKTDYAGFQPPEDDSPLILN